MKLLFTVLLFFGLQATYANEMPLNEITNEAATLDLLETLFEEGEMNPLKDPLTGEVTGFKFSHDSIPESDNLSFNNEEMD